MTDTNRIKIAEAVGWYQDGKWWRNKLLGGDSLFPPDPYTDANDTEAVIRWLNKQGYDVKTNQKASGKVFVEIEIRGTTHWKFGRYYDAVERKDRGTGVCELALKVID